MFRWEGLFIFRRGCYNQGMIRVGDVNIEWPPSPKEVNVRWQAWEVFWQGISLCC